MSTIFSKIISGEIPCFQIAENEEFFSFLDIRPMTLGHALVIPKAEIDYIFDLDDERYVRMFLYAKKIARAIETVVSCKKVGMAVVGLEVPHAHIHLVPLNEVGDMVFGKSISVEPDVMKKMAEDIALALRS